MDLFELLALRGTAKVLRELRQKQRIMYSNLVRIVGHSTTTTRALNAMMELGLIQKEVLNEKYRPVVYSLTVKGRKLADIASELENL